MKLDATSTHLDALSFPGSLATTRCRQRHARPAFTQKVGLNCEFHECNTNHESATVGLHTTHCMQCVQQWAHINVGVLDAQARRGHFVCGIRKRIQLLNSTAVRKRSGARIFITSVWWWNDAAAKWSHLHIAFRHGLVFQPLPQ
jgi:hypothetical protein